MLTSSLHGRLRRLSSLVVLLVAGALLAPAALAADWPGWRGPRGDGRSDETGIPTHWSDSENVAWKVEVPGSGHSSPIVSAGRVFVTSYVPEGNKRVLLCLDRTSGKTLWERTVLVAPPESKNRLNSYASGTPAADGKFVYVAFFEQPRIEVVCYDIDGKEIWRKSPGTFKSVHGFCSSPVLYKNLLILNGDQDADAWIVAYDKATGEEKWRTDRPNKTRSYCTPVITELAGKTQMMLSGSKCVASYDPETGKQIWLIDGPTQQFVASLVWTDGIAFCTGGFPELHLIGIDPSGAGNVTKSNIVWHDRNGVSYVPSPIANEHWFFVVSDNGLCSCLEAKTGKVVWKQRLGNHHSASPVYAEGNLYFPDDAGETFVLKAGPTYEQVAKNDLGEDVRASPAVSDGQLFIRGVKHLWCIGKKAQEQGKVQNAK